MTLVQPPYIRAIIFDLDGVLTDTAEYHFRAWKQLADEEGIPFTREDNEKLRGVSRRRSLELLLDGQEVEDQRFEQMMDRKNEAYREMLKQVTPADLLPGVGALLREIREAGLKIAVASASKNAADVIDNLQIREQIDAVADGFSPGRPKPAPDLFLHAAELLGVPPAQCVCVEDAEAGIEAGNAAGMVTVGLGPAERVGGADLVLPSLEGVSVSDLTRPATWKVSEVAFNPENLHQFESILTQGNGYLGTRGTFEEGYPGDRPATLIHGLWDDVPLIFTELANTPDWAELEVYVDGERFSLATAAIADYARTLDLRTGVLRRRLRWQLHGEGPRVDLYFERVPSLADPHVLVTRVCVEPLDQPVSVEIRAPLSAHAENPGFMREGIVHWDLVEEQVGGEQATLLMETRHTRKRLGISARLRVGETNGQQFGPDLAGHPVLVGAGQVEPGGRLVADKFVGVYTSREAEAPLEAAAQAALAASEAGYEALRQANDAAWAEFWRDGDVIIEGDDEAQLSIRYAVFQLRAAASPHDRDSIAAKALSGFGYRGHVFWDTDIFILPMFTFVQPALARNMLMYRWHTLDGARRNARDTGHEGARYPWESAETGDEITPTWVPDPGSRKGLIRILTGDIELHITADVAYAVWQYWQATGDDAFMRDHGARMILETAVFWGERVEEEDGRFVLREVIGPDEYHENVDNNVFTNRMVQWHLEAAFEVREWLYDTAPDIAHDLDTDLGLTNERLDRWQDIIERMVVFYDDETGLMEQFEGFFDLKELDWPAYEDRAASLQALLGLHGIQKYQVLKQPDAILLLCLLGSEYPERAWQANWDYYAPRTDHEYGSSLGPPIHAWAACEVGEPDIGYRHFMRGARADLRDVRGNVDDGIHAASAGGLWQAVAFGFAGLQLKDREYRIRPRLPSHWKRLAFSFYFNGERQEVDIRAGEPVAEGVERQRD